jgi:predicted PurR-regulated permease PerM
VIHAAPAGYKLFMVWMADNPYGQQVLDQVRGANVVDATGWATAMVTRLGGLVTKGLGYAVIALFVAIYLAAQPDRYQHMCLRLVPMEYRPTAEALFGVIGTVLQRWLVGQLVVMVTIGVLTGIGLSLLGIEAALALGLMGGLLCFIPFVGAILAAIPATLVAMTQGPAYAISVICMCQCRSNSPQKGRSKSPQRTMTARGWGYPQPRAGRQIFPVGWQGGDGGYDWGTLHDPGSS